MENRNFAFFIDGERLSDIDCSLNLLNGNPGIGGSEYITSCLAIKLSNVKNANVYLYTTKINRTFPASIYQILINNLNDAIYHFNKNCNGVFICCPRNIEDFLSDINLKIKIITWEHCYFSEKILNLINNNPCIVKNVCLTKTAKEEKRNYASLYKKTDVIGNFTTLKGYDREVGEDVIFAFVGALIYVKGFHILSNWWTKVVKKIPNAKLYVYGSEKMYYPNKKLGKFSLANEDYEKLFLYPLIKHNALNSVYFKGSVSHAELEKDFKKVCVGLVGISGESETFCISAIDFGMCSIPVICRNVHGLKDTVPEFCGFRFNTKKQFVNSCIKLANNVSLNRQMGLNYQKFVSETYTIDTFFNNWLSTIDNLSINKNVEKVRKNYLNIFIRKCASFMKRCLDHCRRKYIINSKLIKKNY